MSNTISIVLSGGSSNINPNSSLGGDPSAASVPSNQMNNLFEDISKEIAASGSEEYRCVYIFNDTEYTLNNVNAWMYYDFPGSVYTEIGIVDQDEVQRVTIHGPVDGGSLSLSYQTGIASCNYQENSSAWASELQTNLRSMLDENLHPLLPDVVVTATTGNSLIVFDIQFAGISGSRSCDLLTVHSCTLTPSSQVSISLVRVYSGSPINTIATELSSATTVPAGVSFYIPNETSPIQLPKLKLGEGFPIWIRRIIPNDAIPKESDGFTMRISGVAVES